MRQIDKALIRALQDAAEDENLQVVVLSRCNED